MYFLALLAATVVALFGDLGATIASLTFAAGGKLPPQKLHGLALGVAIFAGTVGGALLIGAQPLWARTVLKSVSRLDLTLATVGIVPLLYAQVCGALLTGLGRVPQLSVVRICAAVAAPAIAIPLVWSSHGSATWAVAAWVLAAAAYAAGVSWLLFREGVQPRAPDRTEVRELLGFGLRGQIGTISHQGFLRLDVLFLSARTGPATVGWYSLASVVAEKLTLVGSAIYGASARRVGSAGRDSALLTARLVRTVLLVLVPTGAVLILVARPLITFVFGSDYSAAARPLQILVPGAVCLVLWYLVSLYIITGLRSPGVTTLIQLVALAISVPIYYFAIRSYQMSGAAAASSLVYGLVLCAGIAVFLRRSGLGLGSLRPRRDDARYLLGVASTILRARA